MQHISFHSERAENKTHPVVQTGFSAGDGGKRHGWMDCNSWTVILGIREIRFAAGQVVLQGNIKDVWNNPPTACVLQSASLKENGSKYRGVGTHPYFPPLWRPCLLSFFFVPVNREREEQPHEEKRQGGPHPRFSMSRFKP